MPSRNRGAGRRTISLVKGTAERGEGDSPAGIHVRKARLGDLDHVVRLRLALLREHPAHPIYGRLKRDAERRARDVFAAQLTSPLEQIFLAELGGRVVGILRCVESVASPLLDPPRYCYVSSVFVEPAARRQGVMRALLAAAEGWCDERGLTEMRLHSVAGDPVSNAAWERAGFEAVEVVRRRELGRG